MRSRAVAILACVLVLGVAACSGPTVKEFGRADAQDITKFVQDFMAAYNSKDAAKMVNFYSGAAVLMPPNASTLRGQETIQGWYGGRFSEGATDLVIETNAISGVGTLAYVSGTYSLRVVAPDAPEHKDRGKVLWILRNLANRWRIEYSMWSSDLPPVVPQPEKPAEKPAAPAKK
jgi:ketosteroid isomerase-like protein